MIMAPSDFPQRLRQLRPIRSLEELGAAACQAALMVRAGEISPAQAADGLWDMASASGLLERYGTDAVQAAISYGLRVDPKTDGIDELGNDELDRKTIEADIQAGRALIVQRASEIEIEPIEWLWPGRVAIGKQTLLAGEPGLGKSQIAISIVATVTRAGPWPCGEGHAPSGSALLLCAEDGTADTIVPRLLAAGADLRRVGIVSAVRAEDGKGRRTFNLQADLDLLEKEIVRRSDVRFVGIDPVTSYLGPKVDSHVTAAVRAVLEPVAEMAGRLRVAILSITHPPKGAGAAAINRFTGSLGFVAAARAAFMITRDADDETRRLLLPVKNNLAPLGNGLAFRLEQRIVGPAAKGIVASSVFWESSTVTISADEALRATDAGNDLDQGSKEEAEEFLRDALAAGPVGATELKKQAAELLISIATLRRAKKALGVQVTREGFGPGSRVLWALDLSIDAQTEHRCSG
jgi:putative DNA primase/helicase